MSDIKDNKHVIMDRFARTRFGKKKKLSDLVIELVDYVEGVELEKDSAVKILRDFNKDEQIQTAEKELLKIKRQSMHIMTDSEAKASSDFQDMHSKKCNSRLGFSYILTCTGVGTNVKIKCNKCEEELDITDYKSW
jgi:hypothetical protein